MTSLPSIHRSQAQSQPQAYPVYATPSPRPLPPSSSPHSSAGYPRRRPNYSGAAEEKEREQQTLLLPYSNQTRAPQAGSYTITRFSLDSSVDPQAFQSVRAYLPYVLYQSHPNAKDVAITNEDVLAVFDTVGAHLAALYPANISATHLQSVTNRQTLARLQELAMSGAHFAHMDPLLVALRNQLQNQAAASHSRQVQSEQSSYPAASASKNILSLPHSNAVGSSATAGASGPMTDEEFQRLKLSIQFAVQDRFNSNPSTVQSQPSNPYLNDPAMPASSSASGATHSRAPSAVSANNTANAWSEQAAQTENDIQLIHDFLRSPSCNLWLDPSLVSSGASSNGISYTAGVSAAQAGVEITILEVQNFVILLGGQSGSILHMIRDLNGSSNYLVSFQSMNELMREFSRCFFEKIAQDVFIYLSYPSESNLIVSRHANSANLHSPPHSTGSSVDLAQSLTLADVHQLMLQGGSGIWTLIHLHSLSSHGKNYTSLAELTRSLRQMEAERNRKIDELYVFLNETVVLKELFVQPPKQLKPSELYAVQQQQQQQPNSPSQPQSMPSVSLEQVSNLMYESRGGNHTLHYVKLLVEQLHANSLLTSPTSAFENSDDFHSPSSSGKNKKKFQSFYEVIAMVQELVLKENLYRTLAHSKLFTLTNTDSSSMSSSSNNNAAITVESVNAFYHFILGGGATTKNEVVAAGGLSFFQPGWNLIEYLKGLDRLAYKKFRDLSELMEEIVGTTRSNALHPQRPAFKNTSSSRPESAALVLREVSSGVAQTSSTFVASAPVRTRYIFRQIQERKRLYLMLLSMASGTNSETLTHPLYTGPRVTPAEIDELYEGVGVGVFDTSYLVQNSALWNSTAFLLPHVNVMQHVLGNSFATLTALSHTLRYRMECDLVRLFLQSDSCRLVQLKNRMATISSSSSNKPKTVHNLSNTPAAAASGVAAPTASAMNLTYADIDLLFAELPDRDRDLHLLLSILKQLNGNPETSNNASQVVTFLFPSFKELLIAVRAELHKIFQERNQVFVFLTQDPFGSRSLLVTEPTPSAASHPIRVTLADIVGLIRTSGTRGYTLRYLRGLSHAKRSFHSIPELAEALHDEAQKEIQEKWKIMLFLTNTSHATSIMSPSNVGSIQKPHGLFRQVNITSSSEFELPSSHHSMNPTSIPDLPNLHLDGEGIDRLFHVSRFRTLSYLRALDVAQMSFTSMQQLEATIKDMEMKHRVLNFLNSSACTLFSRPAKPTASNQQQASSSIPTHFSGREIETIWSTAGSGLSTLTYLRLLTSRIGERANHLTQAHVNKVTGAMHVSKGQYTSFADLVDDLRNLHQASLRDRRQVLSYLLQSNNEVATPDVKTSESKPASSTHSNTHTADEAGSAPSFGCHHFFSGFNYAFTLTPQHIDEMFEDQLFDVDEDYSNLQLTTNEYGALVSLQSPSAAAASAAASANASSIFLLNSASVLPVLLRMNRWQHLIFRSWHEFLFTLRQELSKTEEEKLSVLMFLSLQSNLIQEKPSTNPVTGAPSSAVKFTKARVQICMNDIDEVYSNFSLIERGIPVLALLQLLKKEQEEAEDEERELKMSSAIALAAANNVGNPSYTIGSRNALSSDQPLSQSHSLSVSSHALNSLDELGHALIAQHRVRTFYHQKSLLYLKYPQFGNLLLTEESKDALVVRGSEVPTSTPMLLSFRDVDHILAVSGITHSSLLPAFLRALDSSGHRFTSMDHLAHALRAMWKQWNSSSPSAASASGASTSLPLSPALGNSSSSHHIRRYKRRLLRFLRDHFESPGLFAQTSQRGGELIAEELPFSTLAEPLVDIGLEQLDQLLAESAAATTAVAVQLQSPSRIGASNPASNSAFHPDFLLLVHLRALAKQAPAFETFAALQAAIKSLQKQWGKIATTLHRYMNDPMQCSLLPIEPNATSAVPSSASAALEERTTRFVSADQVCQLMMESSTAASVDWASDLSGGEASDLAKRLCLAGTFAQLAESSSSSVDVATPAQSGVFVTPVHDLLDRLLDLDASGRNFDSISALISSVQSLYARLARAKRAVRDYLREHKRHGFWTAAVTAPALTAQALERFFADSKSTLYTLTHLKSLSKRSLRFHSLPSLAEAVRIEHEVKLGGPLKLLRFLLHPSARSLFTGGLISSSIAGAQQSANNQSNNAAAAAQDLNVVKPVKISFPLAVKMYREVAAGASTLNMLVALQSANPKPQFDSLAALTQALQRLVARDRILYCLEREAEGGMIAKEVAPQLTIHAVDQLLDRAETGLSTEMYLSHLSRMLPAGSGRFQSIEELVPLLRRMHVDSIEERRRAFLYLNDSSVQSLLVSSETGIDLDDNDVNVGDDMAEEDEESNAASASTAVDLAALSATRFVPTPSVTSEQIDRLFEAAGAHSFTLLHLQSLSRAGKSFTSIFSLSRAVKRLEKQSLNQRNEVLLFLNSHVPSFFAPAIPPLPSDESEDSTKARLVVSREEVDDLFLMAASGESTLSYLKSFASGYASVGANSAPFSISSVPQFSNMKQLISSISLMHQRSLEQRMRVLQFINNQQRCSLLNGMIQSSNAQSTASNQHTLGTSSTTPLPYIPLASVDTLYNQCGSGILTYPFLLALQASGFVFHTLNELIWSLKTAYDSWEKEKKRVFLCLLQQAGGGESISNLLNSGNSRLLSTAASKIKRKLLDFGGTAIDPLSHQQVDVPLDELISISDIDALFLQSQANCFILPHIYELLKAVEFQGANSFTNWNSFIQAIIKSHEEYLARIHHLLITNKPSLFGLDVQHGLVISPQEIATNMLQYSTVLQAGNIGMQITFYLNFLIQEQQKLSSFPKLNTLQELSLVMSSLYLHDLEVRRKMYDYLSNPHIYHRLFKLIPAGNNAHLKISMDTIHKLFDELGLVGEIHFVHTKRFYAQGKRFSSFKELQNELSNEYNKSCSERKAIAQYLNDPAQQSLFNNVQVLDENGRMLGPIQFSASQINELYHTTQTYGSTISLLKLFDSLQLKFLSLHDLAVALRAIVARNDYEKSRIWKFLTETGHKLLAIPIQVPFGIEHTGAAATLAAAVDPVKKKKAVPTGVQATFDALGLVVPAAAIPQSAVDAASVPIIETVKPITAEDIDQIYSLCRIGPHILRMLNVLYTCHPDKTFASIPDLCVEICNLFEKEVELKKNIVLFLKNSFEFGASVPHGTVPSDLETTVDLYTQPYTLRYIQRIAKRNKVHANLASAASAAVAQAHGAAARRPFDFPTVKSLYEYILACYESDSRTKYHLLKWLKSPFECGIFRDAPQEFIEEFDENKLEELFAQLDDATVTPNMSNPHTSLCESFDDLFHAFKLVEKKDLSLTNLQDLQRGLSFELNAQALAKQHLNQFLFDPRACHLFATSASPAPHNGVPADFVQRIFGSEASFMDDGFQFQYLQILSYAQSKPYLNNPGAQPVFLTTDEVLAELRHLHAGHIAARRNLFLFLNSPHYCSLIQPFVGVTQAQVEKIYNATLTINAASMTNSVIQTASNAGESAIAVTPFIDVQTMVHNMQSSGLSFSSFDQFAQFLTSLESLSKYAVPHQEFMEEKKKQADIEAAKEKPPNIETDLLRKELARTFEEQLVANREVQREKEYMQQELQRLRAQTEAQAQELAAFKNMHQQAIFTPQAQSTPNERRQLSDDEQNQLVTYLSTCTLFSDTTEDVSITPESLEDLVTAGQGLPKTLEALRTLEARGSKFNDFPAIVEAVAVVMKELNDAAVKHSMESTAARASLTGKLPPLITSQLTAALEEKKDDAPVAQPVSTPAETAAPISSEVAPPAQPDAVPPINGEEVPVLTDEERGRFVEYLSESTLFSDMDPDTELAVDSAMMDQLCHIGEGLNNTLFLLKGLDALGKKYTSFAALIPDVESELKKQKIADEHEMNRPQSGVASISARRGSLHVGAPIVTELQMPEDEEGEAAEAAATVAPAAAAASEEM